MAAKRDRSGEPARGLDEKLGQLGHLFMTQGPAVYRRALRLLGNHADAEEATQEVFIRVLRGAADFSGQSQPSTWLYRITTNYCLNQIRDRRRRHELLEEHAAAADERPQQASAGDLLLLRRLLAEADEDQARVAIYIYMDGMTHEEVAEVLAVSRRTVGNQLARFHAWAERRVGPATGRPSSDRSELAELAGLSGLAGLSDLAGLAGTSQVPQASQVPQVSARKKS